jgi:hypothetical protein
MLLRCCLQLFHSLKSHAPGDSEWDDLVAFLQEFCSLAKHLQMQHRQNLWNKMTQLGMFEVRLAGVRGRGRLLHVEMFAHNKSGIAYQGNSRRYWARCAPAGTCSSVAVGLQAVAKC